MNRKFSYILTTAIALYIALVFYRCASLTTPTGGPKDKEPPILIRSLPENNQLNFKGKSVELTFDELIKLNNPKEEIIISPSPGKNVEFKTKGTKVIITPQDGWHDSTTYNIIFQEGVEDITESNSPENLKLAFSTGATIDSLSISGSVKELLKGTPLEKITVALYSADTFDIFTDAPSYFTKTDSSGEFTLGNIKAYTYKIYAFDDKNKNLKVESRAERYGFKAPKIKLEENIDSIEIGLLMLDARPLKISSIRNAGNLTRLRFNKFITNYEITMDSSLTNAFGDNQTELIIWNPASTTDSLRLHLTATDSLLNKTDSVFFVKKGDAKPIKEDFKWTITDPTALEETAMFTALLKFSKPVATINFDSLFIPLDTINRISFSKEDITIDLPHKEIALSKQLEKKILKTFKQLTLRAGKAFVYSIDNDTSKALKLPVTIKTIEGTGILLVKIETKEKNFIVQVLNNEGKLLSSIANETTYTFKNLPPTECQLRIIIDTNHNGKWDPGNILKGQEPENIIFYKTPEGKFSFPIRANWELGPLIIRF